MNLQHKKALNNLLPVNNHYTSQKLQHNAIIRLFNFCLIIKFLHLYFIPHQHLVIKTNKTHYPEEIASHKNSYRGFLNIYISIWLLFECLQQYLYFGSLSPALIRNFKYVRRILTWFISILFIEKRANQRSIKYKLYFMKLKRTRFNL